MGDRLDREIEEILEKYEKTHDRRPVRLRTGFFWRLKRRASNVRLNLPRIRGPQLMLAGVIAVLFAAFFASFLSDTLQRWVLIIGAVVAIVGFFMAVFANRRPPAATEKRWRGQVIRMEDDSLGTRMKNWFGKR